MSVVDGTDTLALGERLGPFASQDQSLTERLSHDGKSPKVTMLLGGKTSLDGGRSVPNGKY